MVERPIKKSERQIASPPDVVEEALETEPNLTEDSQSVTQPPEERSSPRPLPRKDKTKESKSNQQESERSRQVNPALARGPKPTKPKPPVVKTTEAEDSVDADQETVTEGENIA